MNTIKYIKLLVYVELILIFLFLVTSSSLESDLHPILQEFLIYDASADPSTTEAIALLIGLVLILIYFISLFGLIFTKVWAKKAYIISAVGIFIPCFFLGPTVEHAISYTFDQLSVFISGMILALLIFTNFYDEAALNKNNQATQKDVHLL